MNGILLLFVYLMIKIALVKKEESHHICRQQQREISKDKNFAALITLPGL